MGIPLAVGNTVVLKATEEAPISAGFFLAGLLRDAGLPAGVLNVITTPAANAEAVSRTLIEDPRVRRVNFTGSTRVGRKISEMAGNAMKRAVLELGGKNSLIVLADADLDYAVSAAAFSSWINGAVYRAVFRQPVHAHIERGDLRPGLHHSPVRHTC